MRNRMTNRLTPVKMHAFFTLCAHELGGMIKRLSLKSATPIAAPALGGARATLRSPAFINQAIKPRMTGRRFVSAAEQGFTMHITIDACCVTRLRCMVLGACGESVEFMRIQPLAHATKMKVWLRVKKPAVDLVMLAVLCNLPSAEFGRIEGVRS